MWRSFSLKWGRVRLYGTEYHIEVSGDDYSRDSLPTIEEIEKELEMKQFSNKFFKEPIYTCKNTKKMANRKVS